MLGLSSATLPQFYGFPHGTELTQSQLNILCSVESGFLQITGLAYTDLTALLKTQFLNLNQTIVLNPGTGDPCDLSTMTLASTAVDRIGPIGINMQPIDLNQFFFKAHRFIRLWKKLGWQIWELDLAIAVLGAADITAKLIQQLAEIKQIQQNLSLAVDQTLSFWADINTSGRNSLYRRLFLNKAVVNPVDPAFTLTYETGNVSPTLPLSYTFMASGNQISYTPGFARIRKTGIYR